MAETAEWMTVAFLGREKPTDQAKTPRKRARREEARSLILEAAESISRMGRTRGRESRPGIAPKQPEARGLLKSRLVLGGGPQPPFVQHGVVACWIPSTEEETDI